MKQLWPSYLLAICVTSASASVPSQNHCYNWSGYYLGITGGGIFARYNPQTSTQAGPIIEAIEANAINTVGKQNIYTNGFITGIEGGYNWQFNHLLIGLETDLQASNLNGAQNSGAVLFPNHPDRQFVITSYANNNWLFTARARLGFTANHWLFYVTGGLGLTLLQNDLLFTDNNDALESKRVSQVKPGYVVGAGLETGLNDHLSLSAEYLFQYFNNTSAFNMSHIMPAAQKFSSNVNLRTSMLRLGLNYHFKDNPIGFLYPQFLTCWLNQLDFELGVRAFGSSGSIGAPQPLLDGFGTRLISRLTYKYLTAFSGETFARIDHASGIFVKGYLGAGTITNGHLNDEDFPAGGAYSNTFSTALGNLSYANIDLGYSPLITPSGKTGGFVGYHHYTQHVSVYGCRQLAGALVCAPPETFGKFLGIAEQDTLDSVRLGVSSILNITNRITLTAEVAYLPVVNFDGKDDHNARQLIIPEQSNYGDGAMLEAVLNYEFLPCWNVGLGARYWIWNMHSGSVAFHFLGVNEGGTQAARYNTERYGAFVQLSYRNKSCHDFVCVTAPVDWRGLFIGAHLGGAWGMSYWSDPFGSTLSASGRTNIAGFGNEVRSTGPFSGGNVYLNWQIAQFVYGVGAGLSSLDVRGENTFFSGLGGINGQTFINYVATILGRVGTTYNRSLFYINGGPAFISTKYTLNGNTNVLSLGNQSQSNNNWGWTIGAGIEHALTDTWSTGIEYNYIAIPSKVVRFPSIALINQQHIAVRQTMNLFKLNLNYRLNCLD